MKGVLSSLDLAPPHSVAHSVFVMNIRSLLCCFFPIILFFHSNSFQLLLLSKTYDFDIIRVPAWIKLHWLGAEVPACVCSIFFFTAAGKLDSGSTSSNPNFKDVVRNFADSFRLTYRCRVEVEIHTEKIGLIKPIYFQFKPIFSYSNPTGG